MLEKRTNARLSKFIPAMVEDHKVNMLVPANVGDISFEGMRVVCGEFLPKGSCYTFKLKSAPALALKGEVKWVTSTGPQTFRVGVRFIEMTPEASGVIRTMFDDEARKKAQAAHTP